MSASSGPDTEDCTACGACCFTEQADYIELWQVDRDRLGAELARVGVERDGRWHLRMTDGRCHSLVIDPIARRFTCRVYALRPDACRALRPGSAHCRGDQRSKSATVDVAVEQLRRRRDAK